MRLLAQALGAVVFVAALVLAWRLQPTTHELRRVYAQSINATDVQCGEIPGGEECAARVRGKVVRFVCSARGCR